MKFTRTIEIDLDINETFNVLSDNLYTYFDEEYSMEIDKNLSEKIFLAIADEINKKRKKR